MSTLPRLGEIVNITINGVRFVGTNALTGAPTIADEHGDEYPMPPQAAIERVAPAHWPPRFGDVWRDAEGELWVLRRCYSGMDQNGPTYREEFTAISDTLQDEPCHIAAWLQQHRGPLTLVSRIEPDQGGGA